MTGFCRDCLAELPDRVVRCSACGSPRTVRHPELDTLTIAHVDCDAFYAAIEKRDDPSLRDKPVIIGGGRRGVVATACYVATGLSANKFLAKIASDLDKPRGFSVLGRAEARPFLAPRPVGFIWGVGKATQARLAKDGFVTIADLAVAEEAELMRRYGAEGLRLSRLSRGIDERRVEPEREAKSVSAETTFDTDIAAFRTLERRLWLLAEKVSARLKAAELSGGTVTLKLKTTDFRIRTRARGLGDPTQLAGKIFANARDLLLREADGTAFRLIGVGVSDLGTADQADPVDLVDIRGHRLAAAEHAVDELREKFGRDAVIKGLALGARDEE